MYNTSHMVMPICFSHDFFIRFWHNLMRMDEVTGDGLNGQGSNPSGGRDLCLLLPCCGCVWGPPSMLSWAQQVFSRDIVQFVSKGDCSVPSSLEEKNAWRVISIFLVLCLDKAQLPYLYQAQLVCTDFKQKVLCKIVS